MSTLRQCFLVAMILSAPGVWPAPAQTTTAPAPTSAPMPELVPAALDRGPLKMLPEACIGFAVIHNVKDFTGRIDTFIRRVAPEGADLGDFRVMKHFLEQANLGETFNPDGGFAVALLDPRKYAPELARSLKPASRPPGTQPAATGPVEQGEQEPLPDIAAQDVPFVFVVPGKDAMKMFEAHSPSKVGKDIKLAGDGTETPWFCREVPGYVVLAAKRDVLDALPADKSVLGRLSPSEQAAIARNGAAVWVDFKAMSLLKETPLGAKVGEQLGEFLDGSFNYIMPWSFVVKYILATRGESLAQAESRLFGARVVQQGLVFELRGRYPPDSAVGKALLACRPTEAPLLGSLPNMPYIFAAGATKDLRAPAEVRVRQIDRLLSSSRLANVPEQVKAQFREVMLGMREEMQSVQWYFGGVTTGQGQLALVCVLECSSPARVKKLLRSGAEAAPKLLAAVFEEDWEKLPVKYLEGVEEIDGIKADAISIEPPELAKMEQEDRNKMRGILGDDKFRLLIAPGGQNRLVITFGGGTALLKEVLKTAGGTGRLQQDPSVRQALAMLPPRPVAAGLINLGNAWNVMANVSAFMGAEIPPQARHLDAPVPLAGAFAIEKNELSFTAFVPTESIRRIVQAVQRAMSGFMEGHMDVPSDEPQDEQ